MNEAMASWFSVAVLFVAFFVGSVPFKRIFSRLSRGGKGRRWEFNFRRKVELTPASVATVFFDTLKGAMIAALAGPAGVALVSLVSGHQSVSAPAAFLPWAAVCAGVLGHCFAPWSRAMAPKGMLPALGGAFVLAPLAGVAGALVFAAAYFSPLREPAWPDGSLDRSRPLAALIGLLVSVILLLVIYPIEGSLWPAALVVFIIILRHESDIDGLVQRHES